MDKNYAQYLLKKTIQDYNLIAGEFSSTRNFPWGEISFFVQEVSPGDKILDLGCGNGRLLELFKGMDIKYFGVDNSEKLIEIAKKKHPDAEFQIADAFNLPFPDNYFDKIFCIAVLHHIPSKELRSFFIAEARRVLRKNGRLFLTVWDLWQWRGWKANLKYAVLKILGLTKLDFRDVFVPWGKFCQRYIHCFIKKELESLVKSSGMKIKKIGILKRQARGNNLYMIVEK